MSDRFQEKLREIMLAQQMETNKALIARYANSAGVRLPPLANKNGRRNSPTGGDKNAQNYNKNNNNNSARQPYVNQQPGNNNTNGMVPYMTGNGQFFYPWGRTYYYGKMAIPAAFNMTTPHVEVEPLNLPKERGVFVVKEEETAIDWEAPEGAWKKERSAIKLRHIFYVSWFISLLKASIVAKGKIYETKETTDETVLFEILIKEIIYAIHRIYLDKNSEMFRLMMQIVKTGDLSVALDEAAEGQPFSPALEEIVYLLENIIFQITYIQPLTGVLGTNYRSFLISLIKDGQLFPLNEFWAMEKKWLKFDYTGRTINSGEREASLLIMMVFLARGLVWTLLLHPEDYGLAKKDSPLSGISRGNLKLMATLFLFVYRRVIIPRHTYRIPDPPKEIARFLLPDDSIKPLVERIENSLFYCDGLVREWSSAYVRRLKQVEKK